MTTDLAFRQTEQPPLKDRVTEWLSAFEGVLGAQDYPRLSELFVDDSHWRDMGAFTWDLGAVSGLETIEKLMRATVGDVKPSDFELASKRTAPARADSERSRGRRGVHHLQDRSRIWRRRRAVG